MESQLNFSGELGFKNSFAAVSKSESCKHIIWTACGIFVLALTIRLFYIYESSDNPTFDTPIVDARGYDLLARELVDEGRMAERFFWQQFFYPCFLSAVYFFSNCSVVVAQVVQAVLGAVNCVLTFFLGRLVFNRRTGILAAIFVAFYGPLIFHEMDLIAAGWVAFWSLVLVLLSLRVAARKQLLGFFILGLCGALSIITRPNFVPFFLAILTWLGFVFYKAHTGRSFIIKCFFLIVSGFTLIALPVAIQNFRVTGHFGILPATGAVNLYIGNHPDFDAAEIRPGKSWERIVEQPIEHGIQGSMWDNQDFFYKKAFNNIVSYPLNFLKRLVTKVMQFISSREMPGDVDIYLFRQWSKLLELLMWKAGAFGFPFGLLLPLAIVGLVYNRRNTPIPVILFVITYPLPIILTHVKTRYRVPMVPVLSILAASGCLWLIRNIIGRDWLRFAGAICLGIGIVSLASFPGPFTAEKIDYLPELYVNVGITLRDQGKLEEAANSFKMAIQLNPEYSEAYLNLGIVLSKQGETTSAINNFNQALRLDPNDHYAHNGLGAKLCMQGKYEQGRAHYIKALDINPSYLPARKNLAMELARQGKIDEAIWHNRQALRFHPDNAEVHKNLGGLLAQQGKINEAIEHFHEAIRIEPDFVDARKAIAVAFAINGRFTEAFEQFRYVLQMKPADADAHYFLGVLLAQKENFDEAIKEFREVLQIDPNHADAQDKLDILLLRK